MIEIETIKTLLEIASEAVVHSHGQTEHPWHKDVMVESVTIFANKMMDLETQVEVYEKTGYTAWIVGRMEGIPAAYLIKEINNGRPE